MAFANDGASWQHAFTATGPLSGYGTAAVAGAVMYSVDGPRYNVSQGAVTTLTGNRVEQITLLTNGSLTHRSTGRNATWSGMPAVGCRANVPDSPKSCPLRTFGADVLLLPDGSWLGAFLAYPATSDPNASEAYSLYAFKSSDAADWRFASVVAERVPDSEEGPSENALTLLANGSVLAVFDRRRRRQAVRGRTAVSRRRRPPDGAVRSRGLQRRRRELVSAALAARRRLRRRARGGLRSVLGCSRSRAARCCSLAGGRRGASRTPTCG